MSEKPEATDEKPLMDVLEQGVRDVLKNRKAKMSERVAAISAGTKLLAIKNKMADDAGGFFS